TSQIPSQRSLPQPNTTLFPTRRASDLFDCRVQAVFEIDKRIRRPQLFLQFLACDQFARPAQQHLQDGKGLALELVTREELQKELDRKSTRLNSSHRTTSYAVFCLKN